MVFVLIEAFLAFLDSVMERGSDDTQQPSLCRMGCGFYGSSSSDGMCSKCFKDALRRKQSSPTTSAATVMSSPSTGWCSKSKKILIAFHAFLIRFCYLTAKRSVRLLVWHKKFWSWWTVYVLHVCSVAIYLYMYTASEVCKNVPKWPTTT